MMNRNVTRVTAVLSETSLLLFSALVTPSTGLAETTITLQIADDPGTGFYDETPASPVGGNNGTTLGDQRINAFEYALSIYQKVLFSDVPIVVEAKFSDLPCDDTYGAVLGASAPAVAVSSVPGGRADPNVVYPIALANHLAGSDLDPDTPDITVELNANVDQGCLGSFGWYYGLDGNGSQNTQETDFVRVVLHELGHGLGFIDFVDRDTGEALFSRPDVFSLHVFDNLTGERWSEMTNSERVASLTHVRNVVWDGQYATAFAPDYLVLGSPIILTTPQLSGFSAVISEAGYGPPLADGDVEGELVVGSPANGCVSLTNDASDKIVLLYAEECMYEAMTARAQKGGALAVLIAAQDLGESPPPHLAYYSFVETNTIPTVSITLDDAEILQNEIDNDRPVTITLASDPYTRVGTDAEGRVYLLATEPMTSNSISHWDFLARNDLLMEPQETIREEIHDIDLTSALLRDIGWNTVCGNGERDEGEECDDGPLNSDTEPDACRTTCRPHSCGDGVIDSDEHCDSGLNNSDDLPDQCRTDCTNPICGDGVVDSNEECDSGDSNSDTEPDVCRADCKNPRCGDAVVDSNEECEPDIDDAIACDDTCSISEQSAPTQEQPDQEQPDQEEPNQQQPNQQQPVLEQPKQNTPVITPSGTEPSVLQPTTLGSEGEPISPNQDDGCGCRTLRRRNTSATPLMFILLTLTIALRRRHEIR